VPADEAAAGQVDESAAAIAAAGNRVVTSGKSEVPLEAVPAEVMTAARNARPGFTATEAESETRDGRNYYDIGGTMPDGSEIEFDIMEEGGTWRVVETQRDIAFAAAPEPVRLAARRGDPAFAPTRVIESVQADGVTIYELYAQADGDPEGRKVEVRWDGREAVVLEEEWEH
jgi:uncharacterized membrane protein YkoI